MNPDLLKALNKGGGKPPSKVKGKAKKKAPPKRPDQKFPEKQNPNAGRVVGKNYKPKAPGSGVSAAASPPRPPQNNELLGNILAARQNMKKKGGKGPKSGGSSGSKVKKPSPSSPNTGNKWGAKKPKASPQKPKASPEKKWGFKKDKAAAPPPNPIATQSMPPKPNKPHKPPSIASSVTSPTNVQSPGSVLSSKEVQSLRDRISALEAENKSLSQKLKTSDGKEKKLMETIVRQQNDYNALQKKHKMLQQQFDELKSGKSEKGSQNGKSTVSTNSQLEPGSAESPKVEKHKKKSSFMNLFGGKKKDLAKELEVEPDEDDQKTAKTTKTEKKSVTVSSVQSGKSMPPPKAAGRKKPVIPKDDVVVPKLPPRPPVSSSSGIGGKASKPPKAPGNGASGGNDAWSAYVAKFGNAPASASQLQSFSKSNADVPTLNFKQARDLFNARK